MDKEIYVLGIGRNSITMIDLAEDCGYRIAGLLHYNHDCIGEHYFDYRIDGCFEDIFLFVRRCLIELLIMVGRFLLLFTRPLWSLAMRK